MTNQELTESVRQLNSAVEKLSVITQEQCNYKEIRKDYASLIKALQIVADWKRELSDLQEHARLWLLVYDREQYRIEE